MKCTIRVVYLLRQGGRRVIMGMAAPGQLNLNESPSWGSRSVDCFEKLEQIGEGTYGLVIIVN